ncbi:MAG: CYTH domain-containing protein [Trueperaceae bacterium]|nr:CYTH domain-containing protein [Trueperaceae bacterium]
MPQETELKFSLTVEEVPEAGVLAAALQPVGLTLGRASQVVHKDRYYDDARLSLSRAGYALRRRMADGRMLATLKTLGSVEGALHRRDELEDEIPADAPAWNPWPAAISERIGMVTDVRSLRGAFELTTERRLFDLLDAGRRVAVASFDAVAARRTTSERTVHWNELEIEAVAPEEGGEAAREDALRRAAEAIGTVVALVPASHTKLERARALLSLGAALDE